MDKLESKSLNFVGDDTPIAMLTVGQLRAALAEKEKPEDREEEKEYLYGIAGIRKLFNVSHVTAQRYKDGILREACHQVGRKIIIDKKKALELFEKGGRK